MKNTAGSVGSGTQQSQQSGHPAIVDSVMGEIQPGDPTIWQPGSFAEWLESTRTQTLLSAWSNQMDDERGLRKRYAMAIFSLIVGQVIGVFSLVVAQGLGSISLDVSLLKVLLPAVLTEVFGLGFLVTKYLFNQPLRHSLDVLVHGLKK